jgi:hypothetical protein
MSVPCCKIEIYENDDDPYPLTLTTDILECHTTDILTVQPGTFNFSLPIKNATSYIHLDIGNNYKAKIYFGYDGGYTHVFSGKILPLLTQVSQNGLTRTYTGKSLSEILERRFKYNTRWQNISAHDIVASIASDLSLSSSIDAEATEIPLTVTSESYFDILRKISDYWIDSSNKITRDFGVNKDNQLIWKNRPLRTGITAPVYGTDFLLYNLTYDILPIKNYITVYGAQKTFYPIDQDTFTESLTGWACSGLGNLELSSDHQIGTYSVRLTNTGTMTLTLDKTVNLRDINTLTFQYKPTTALSAPQVFLLAPDTSNYFLASLINDSNWHVFNEKIGEENEYKGLTTLGTWHSGAGHPNWWNIQGVKFAFNNAFIVDGLYFSPDRPIATASNATSISVYDQREAEYTDENLMLTEDCQARAETLLYQQKNRVLRLDFTVPGTTAYQVGDRFNMSLPPDEIVNMPFDVASLDYDFSGEGYATTLHMVDTALTRVLPALSPLEAIQQQTVRNRLVLAQIYSKIVR